MLLHPPRFPRRGVRGEEIKHGRKYSTLACFETEDFDICHRLGAEDCSPSALSPRSKGAGIIVARLPDPASHLLSTSHVPSTAKNPSMRVRMTRHPPLLLPHMYLHIWKVLWFWPVLWSLAWHSGCPCISSTLAEGWNRAQRLLEADAKPRFTGNCSRAEGCWKAEAQPMVPGSWNRAKGSYSRCTLINVHAQ